MSKKLSIFQITLGILVTAAILIGCGEKAATSSKAGKAVGQKIVLNKKAVSPPVKKAAEQPKPETTAAKTETDKPQEMATASYDPSGRIDPFAPLFRKEPEPAPAAAKVTEPTRPISPLEKIELSQLKLKAIIRTAGGNKALVEEASGKGYIIKKGTFIGTHRGNVVAIEKDRVVVQEEIEDVLGKINIQEKELKLQKPLGEE